jgi:hypothetical protein
MAIKCKFVRPGTPARRPPAAHLLIIECESAKLAADNLAIGTEIERLARIAFPRKHIVLIQTSTTAQLLKDLADTSENHPRFRSILIVGHSNLRGLKLTSEPLRSWDAVGKWIAGFSPEFLLLTACEAGNSLPAGKLFQALKHLKEVYASPTKFYRDQAYILFVIIHQLLEQRKMDAQLLIAAQVTNFVLTHGILFKWTRREFRSGKEVQGKLWDLAAMVSNRRT